MSVHADEKEQTLGEVLAERARRASDSRLAGDAISAILAAIAIGVWRGPAWDLRICIAVCILAFAIWGVADRDLESRIDPPRRTVLFLKSARIVAAIVGFAAAALLMLSLLGHAIGRVIS